MIPKSVLDTELEITDEPLADKTYKTRGDKIQGYINGLDALSQMIQKMLSTEQYEYPIYSNNYGLDISSLIGKDRKYVRAELKRRIKECLISDERVQSVDGFTFNFDGDILTCNFTVTSIYGELLITKEVNV